MAGLAVLLPAADLVYFWFGLMKWIGFNFLNPNSISINQQQTRINKPISKAAVTFELASQFGLLVVGIAANWFTAPKHSQFASNQPNNPNGSQSN